MLKNLSTYVKEHYPSASYSVYPTENDTKIAIIIVANKYSPKNYWYESQDYEISASCFS